MLLLPAILAFPNTALASPGDATTLWVELPSPADRARARDAGFGWAEGQDGDWYLLLGTAAMAEAAGLSWRQPALFPEGWSPTAAEVHARLDALPSGTLVQIGESALGAPLLAVRFGSGGRALRVLGGHHGDEASSVEVALRVAEALADGAVALPDDTEVWVVPAVNPDGLDARTRVNANGVDLNRNYGWEWSATEPFAGAAAFSEPETRAIRALSRARTFDAGLSLHSGAQNIGWVWNWTADERPPEEPLLVALAEDYAATTGTPDFWTTNGADWYETRGDTTDWSYGSWGAYDFTVELTLQKAPPAEEVDTYVAWHLDAILGWIARPPDIAGVVVDAATGEPIPAVLAAPGGVQALETGPTGAAARWTEPDGEALVASAPGYAPAAFAPETRLDATGLLSLLPSPRLVSRGGEPVRLTIPGLGEGPLDLLQPGEPTLTLPPDGPGAWIVDPLALAPGAWTLSTEEGVLPRALFVGEVDDRVRLTSVALEGTVLSLRGAGFAPGAEAWSIGGPARALHPLTRLSESDDALVFLLDSTDQDVLVWVNGAWLSAVNVQGAPVVDLTPPAVEPVPEPIAEADPELSVAGACATGPAGAGGLGLAAGLALVLRRGRATTPGRSPRRR